MDNTIKTIVTAAMVRTTMDQRVRGLFERAGRTIGIDITCDAVMGHNSNAASQSHQRMGGWRLTDLSALVGSVVWIGLLGGAVTETLRLSPVELFVCFALLTLVPLGIGLAATPRRSDGQVLPYRMAAVGQFPAAVGVVGALSLPVGTIGSVALVLPWLLVTALLAVFGLWRLLSRERIHRPLPELAIDAALFYMPVGAVALLLHRAGISIVFDPIIILLTVVHYHYAGFVLPLVTGLAGRIITSESGRFGPDLTGRVATLTTVVIIVNLALIAVGITFSPLVEIIAVAFFTVAVAGFSILLLTRVVPQVPVAPQTLLTVASVAIFMTMALALAYGYSAFSGTVLITIGEMIRWHGSLNAFGFALPALLAFRLFSERWWES